MNIQRIFIEKDLKDQASSNNFVKAFPKAEILYIDSYEEVFQKVKKPYLQKRTTLQIFLAKKKGALVKRAPDAYGLSGDPHFYYIHAFNCIYECQYCYLQGYFQSPDLVFFLNHSEIISAMKDTYKEWQEKRIWFHAGEFSDSLALSHLSAELPLYFSAMQEMPNALLELRTKSANTKELEKLESLDNITVSFSFSSKESAKAYDNKTASITARIKAMKKLYEKGYKLALHLDPIIDQKNLLNAYKEALDELFSQIPPKAFSYISLGVVRFTKDVFQQVENNYQDSSLLGSHFVKSFDNKVRYSKPLRDKILYGVKEILSRSGVKEEQIYLCMEDD